MELSFQNVSFAYPDGRRALSDVSFELGASRSLGLVGANGAGKSTLLLLLPGVLLPTSGEIMIGGRALSRTAASDIRHDVGLVFQHADDQLFTQSVYDDVAFGPRNMGLSEPEVDRAVRRALERCGASALSDRAPYKLSGGEQRLAAIASVLSMEPGLLAFDEPSASLDPRARRNLIGLLASLEQPKLIASHDLDLIWDVCDRVIVLRDGRIAADGETHKLLSDESFLQSCSLELPRRLLC